VIVDKYGLKKSLPSNVKEHLQLGRDGQEPETLKRVAPCYNTTQNVIIGSNLLALEAAKKSAENQGHATKIIDTALQGEAREVAQSITQTAAMALQSYLVQWRMAKRL